MLIEFKLSNYRSICEEQILSLVPAKNLSERPKNILDKGPYQALNAIAIYGANSSGKSNFIKGIELVRHLLIKSAKASSESLLPFDPFLLRAEQINKPSSLELSFVIGEIRYRYGLKFNQNSILEEWLFRKKIGREVNLFYREQDIIDTSSAFGEGVNKKLVDAAIEATRDNALFLSFCDMFNIPEAKTIFSWFNKLAVVNGLETDKEELTTIALWRKFGLEQQIKEYLSLLDLGFIDLSIQEKEFDPSSLPEGLSETDKQLISQQLHGHKQIQVSTSHKIYNNKGEPSGELIHWLIQEKESAGTQKAFSLSGPVLHALNKGSLLVIDEIEAKIHPIITANIIELFLSSESNPKQAQLIFATHDSNLLHYSSLRRDQINFIEKNKWEASEIYALSDMKFKDNNIERIDTDKEKRYLEGRYGAIPILGNLREFISKEKTK